MNSQTSVRSVFAYGALIDTRKLAERLRVSESEAKKKFRFSVVILRGFRRTFYKLSKRDWNGLVFNIVRSTDHHTMGLLIEGFSRKDLDLLDRSERTYVRQLVTVEREGKNVTAFAYMYEGPGDAGQPSRRYAKLLLTASSVWGPELKDDLVRNTYDVSGNPIDLENLAACEAKITARRFRVHKANKADLNKFIVRMNRQDLISSEQCAPALIRLGQRELRVMARTPIDDEVKPEEVWINETLRLRLGGGHQDILGTEVDIAIEEGYLPKFKLGFAHLRCPNFGHVLPLLLTFLFPVLVYSIQGSLVIALALLLIAIISVPILSYLLVKSER